MGESVDLQIATLFSTPRGTIISGDVSANPRNKRERELELTGDLSLRLDELFEIWFHKSKPLLDATFNISTTLLNISQDLNHVSKFREVIKQVCVLLRDKQVSASASQNI